MGDGLAVNALLAVWRREWADIRQSTLAQAQLLWLPAGIIILLWALFSQGTATEIPMAVVDLDQSSTSRQLVRTLNASPGLAVTQRFASLAQARSAVRRGQVEGVVYLPADWQRQIKRGEPAEVTAWFNAQFLLTGNTLSRELQTAVLTFSAQAAALGRIARGESKSAVALQVQPIATRRDSLHNPYLNYVPFLVAGLAAAVVQMFAMLGAVRVVGRELRQRTVPDWMEAARGRITIAVLGKLLAPTVSCLLMGSAFLAGLHGWLGWPLPGHPGILVGALLLMILAYEGLGLVVVGVTANYRLASSVAAFVTAPALAFAGLTFPLNNMPAAAAAWGQALPLTLYLKVQIAQAVRGAPAATSEPELLILAAIAGVTLLLAVPLLRWRVNTPTCWGRP